jgi:hypothetical protein
MNNENKIDLIDSAEFLEFVNSEFENTVQHATTEDLAVFAFGDLDTAIAAFINQEK